MRAPRFLILIALAAGLHADTFQDLSARATAARESNDTPRAVALYREALNLNSQWQEGWWFLGTLLYDADQFAPAREAFQQFVDLNAQAAPGWAFLGLCEFETGDFTKALHDVEHGLALGADKEPQLAPVLLYHEALLLTRQRQYDAALQKYAALIRDMEGRTPNESLLLSVGLAALRAPLVPKDVPASDKDVYVDAGRAASFVLMGEYPQADAAFQTLIEKYPKTPNVHYAHGVYLIARDPEKAFEEFRCELQVFPGNTAADTMLAWGLLSRGDSEQALPYAEKALNGADNPPFAEYLLGRALVETGTIERGLRYLLQAESADKNNSDVHVTLAAAYSRIGQVVDARREREIAMRMESENRSLAHP